MTKQRSHSSIQNPKQRLPKISSDDRKAMSENQRQGLFTFGEKGIRKISPIDAMSVFILSGKKLYNVDFGETRGNIHN